MKIADLLSMSAMSLIKRRLRTLLTVLGVVIGISSIVIMVSLGLGLNKKSMDMIERYGGLTTITVTEGGDGPAGIGDSSSKDTLEHKLSDQTVELFKSLDHVILSAPVLQFQCILRTGPYENDVYQGYGYTREVMEKSNWKFAEGGIPKENEPLKFIYGNFVKRDFFTAATGLGYYDTGTVPDIDLMNAPIFTIFDVDGYRANTSKESKEPGIESDADPDNNTPSSPPKKLIIGTAGVLYGANEEDYNDYSYGVYCDIDRLKTTLKQVFRNRPIPGQPVRKNGRPYRDIYYSNIMVRVDSVDNMAGVQKQITDLGYNAYSNSEWIAETRESSRSQQAMLGGIGAVSLLVAAIGIANTMMMSIYERTKEIGIMKVLGCDLKNIRQMFLLEAVLIGFFGGVAGDLISILVSLIINSVTGEATSLIPLWLLSLGLFFAMLVGMLAGYFPSKRAMELSALSAIRNE